MSHELTSPGSLDDLFDAATRWTQTRRRTALSYALAGGALAALIHLFAPRLLPPAAQSGVLYLDFTRAAGLGDAVAFWLCFGLIAGGLVAAARTAGLKAILSATTGAPRRWGAYLTIHATAGFGALSLGLAVGFVLVALCSGPQIAGFSAALITPTPLHVAAILLLALGSLSPLATVFGGSVRSRRTAAAPTRIGGASTADWWSIFFAACALPLIITLPVGSWLLTTRVAVLLAVLGLAVWWISGNTSRSSTLSLLVWGAALFLAVSSSSMAAEPNVDGNGSFPPITTEQLINATLAFIVTFVASGAGAALGHALCGSATPPSSTKIVEEPTAAATQ